MNQILRKTTRLALLALLLLLAGGRAFGAGPEQGSGQGQPNPQNPQKPNNPPTQPGQPASLQLDVPAPAVNAEEEATYKTFFETKIADAQSQIRLGEDFLKKYPQSRYREGVYARLTSAYLTAGQEEKMFAAGDKALELNPSNVDVMALMALVLPRRVNVKSLDADQTLQKSEKYSRQAIAMLTEMQKPTGMSDEDFAKAKNEKLSMCHSGLGIVQFHRQKWVDAAAELEQATKLAVVPDPVDYYVMALAYQKAKHYPEAATAYGRCSESGGPLQPNCKQGMEQMKKLAATQLAPPKP